MRGHSATNGTIIIARDFTVTEGNYTTEAGRVKYIFVWILASAITTVVTYIPDLITGVAYEILAPALGLHYAYAVTNGVIGTVSVAVTLLVYALFRNVYIQRVMPYFWLLGALGFVYVAGLGFEEIGFNYERSGLLYIDLLIQFVGVFLLYWLPSTFWPRKYYPPKGRYADSPKHVPKRGNLEKRPTDALPHEKREPSLSAPKRNQFDD